MKGFRSGPVSGGTYDQEQALPSRDQPHGAHAGHALRPLAEADQKGPSSGNAADQEMMSAHGIPDSAGMRRRPGGDQATGADRAAGRPATWRRRRSSAGCFRPAGRRSTSPASRAAASPWSATCSAPWTGCGTSSAIRSIAWSGWCGWRSTRPTCSAARGSTGRRPGRPGAPRPRKVRSGPVLAHETTLDQLPQLKCWPRRRRGLHHAAAGLHRGPRRPGAGTLEPGHVPRADLRRPVRAGPSRSGCTTSSTAGSAGTMRRPSAARSCCG